MVFEPLHEVSVVERGIAASLLPEVANQANNSSESCRWCNLGASPSYSSVLPKGPF